MYLDEAKGVPLQDVWTDIVPVQGGATENYNYPTQKPEKLLERIIELGSHDMFIGRVVAVSVGGKYIDEKNKLWLDKANLVAYSHGEYFLLGKKIGHFGYSVRKKQKK